MEIDVQNSVSENGIEETHDIDAYVDTLQINVENVGQDYYSEQLETIAKQQECIIERLDTLIGIGNQSVSQNAELADLLRSDDTLSDNSISENAIMNTPIAEYSVSESLLLFTCIITVLILCLLMFFNLTKGE